VWKKKKKMKKWQKKKKKRKKRRKRNEKSKTNSSPFFFCFCISNNASPLVFLLTALSQSRSRPLPSFHPCFWIWVVRSSH
jgi:hypothetical protein